MATRLPPIWPTPDPGPDPFDDVPPPARSPRDAATRSVQEAAVQALTATHTAVRQGRVPLASLDAAAEAVGLHDRPVPDRRTHLRPGEPPSLDDLIRIAADFSPASGMDAADQFLGPWADVVDVRVRAHLAALRSALGGYALVVAEAPLAAAVDRWRNRRPAPPRAERARATLAQQAPVGAWHVHRRTSSRWTVTDAVGLHPRFCPDTPVRVDAPGAVSPLAQGPVTLLARVVPTPSGWTAVAPLAVPGHVPTAAITAWVHLLQARVRLRRRHDPLAVILARHGHVLVRRVHEWTWART